MGKRSICHLLQFSRGPALVLTPGEVLLHYIVHCSLVSRLIAPICLEGKQREVTHQPKQNRRPVSILKSGGSDVNGSQTFPTPVSGSSVGQLLPKGWGAQCSMVGRVRSSAAGPHPTLVWPGEQSSDSDSSYWQSGDCQSNTRQWVGFNQEFKPSEKTVVMGQDKVKMGSQSADPGLEHHGPWLGTGMAVVDQGPFKAYQCSCGPENNKMYSGSNLPLPCDLNFILCLILLQIAAGQILKAFIISLLCVCHIFLPGLFSWLG